MEIVCTISFGFCFMLARHDGEVRRTGSLAKSKEYKASFVNRKEVDKQSLYYIRPKRKRLVQDINICRMLLNLAHYRSISIS